MCGRARCTVRVDSVGAACGFRAPLRAVNADRYQPSYNVAPGAHMPVVRHDGAGDAKEPVVHCMRWGLVPSFTKKSERPDFFRMFNARSESVHEKTSFRRLLAKNRCLATLEGFYEWKKDGKQKQPYYVHMEDGHPLVFAALYDTWESPEGETMYTFTILTTRASKRLEWLHDRMPVILKSQDAIDSWLNSELSEDSIHKLTQPYESPDLTWYPVTPAMGRPAFNGPECVEEIKPKVASESKIAQMFGKQLAHQNTGPADKGMSPSPERRVSPYPNKGMSPNSDKGMSPDFRDGDYLNEEDFKALLAGMEPDQDVTKAVSHPEGPVDRSKTSALSNDSSSLKEQLHEDPRPHQDKDTETPGPSPQLVKSEEENHSPHANKEEESATLGRAHGPTSVKISPVSTPVKPQARKASPAAKDNDSKRQRTTDTSKLTSKTALDAGAKQKQSNLLGFFSKQ
ncbi:hypothetical protein M758_8G041900 [Ceratodon purpureus]|nr:hypothetical protein M758_8G041900 [Ceratodon purpureus]